MIVLKSNLKKALQRLRGEVPLESLKDNGLQVGENFKMRSGCVIDYSHSWLIKIGNDVEFAPKVHILAHDGSLNRTSMKYTKVGLVNIGNNVFIGAGSIVLPNVTIGNNVIIGAGSIVNKDIPDNTVAAGNPAAVLCSIQEYEKKNLEKIENRPTFDRSWRLGTITESQKKIMIDSLKDGIGYLK